MKRLFRILLFFSFGYLVGKNRSERTQRRDAAKIINASYLDNNSKIRLLKDLGGQQLVAKQKQGKVSKKNLLKKRIFSAAQRAKRLTKPILKIKK